MFSRYTERAQRVIVLAQDEARLLQFDYVGTEHLLLALIREGENAGVATLRNLGIAPDHLRDQIRSRIGQGLSTVRGEIGFTPRAKRVMVEHAIHEARRLGHNFVGCEHILVGIAMESKSVSAIVLQELGVTLERLQAATSETLGAHPEDAASQPTPMLPLSKVIHNGLLFLASEEAKLLGRTIIEPEHLLLAMLRSTEPTLTARVLAERGISYEWLRDRLSRE